MDSNDTTNKETTMTRKQQISRLNKSIALQVRTRDNLSGMVIDNGTTVELCNRIIANMQAKKSILEGMSR